MGVERPTQADRRVDDGARDFCLLANEVNAHSDRFARMIIAGF